MPQMPQRRKVSLETFSGTDGSNPVPSSAKSATNRSSSAPSIASASRSRAADAGWTDPEGRRPWFSPKLGTTSLVAHGRGLQRPARCAGSFLALSTIVPGVAEDWTCFEDALAAANFWSLHRNDFRRGGLDGARWTILGRRNGLFHIIHHWSPCGPVYNLGRRFVELAGLDEIRGHFQKKILAAAHGRSHSDSRSSGLL